MSKRRRNQSSKEAKHFDKEKKRRAYQSSRVQRERYAPMPDYTKEIERGTDTAGG